MSQPVLLRIKMNCIENCKGSIFVLLSLSYQLSSENIVPDLKINIGHFVWESFSADGNTCQNTITLILMHDQAWFNHARHLVSVWYNTTNEGWFSWVQDFHQVIQLPLVKWGHSFTTTLLPATTSIFLCFKGLTRMIMEAFNQQWIWSILEELNNCVIQRVLVLFKPTSKIVWDNGSIVNNSKVGIWIGLGIWLLEVITFSKQIFMQLVGKGQVCCLGEKRLLFKDGQKTHWLLKHVNTFLQIHSKVNIFPFNSLSDIFLLFKYKHVLVEELLKLFIAEVDTNLLKTIVVKNLKTSNIKTTNVRDFLHCWIHKGQVTFVNNEPEDTFINWPSNTRHRAWGTRTCLAFVDPFSTNLQLGFAEVGDHPLGVNSTNISNDPSICFILDLSLLLLAYWDKVLGQVAHVHDNSCQPVDIVLLIIGES